MRRSETDLAEPGRPDGGRHGSARCESEGEIQRDSRWLPAWHEKSVREQVLQLCDFSLGVFAHSREKRWHKVIAISHHGFCPKITQNSSNASESPTKETDLVLLKRTPATQPRSPAHDLTSSGPRPKPVASFRRATKFVSQAIWNPVDLTALIKSKRRKQIPDARWGAQRCRGRLRRVYNT